ncbi:hypothetical protein LCGC14_2878790 [marine sediment metagenome]|uniref:Sulfotransferase family protein n=1 Tax=marine sediment metagenome TaxID=412755 RepID=A0A0F9A8V5_9ZZZZ
MFIDEKNKFIFIHVYKTGGESITVFLGGQNYDHPKHIAYNELPNWRHDYFSFGFVRNPWDRVVSSYTYLTYRNKFKGSFEEYITDFLTTPKNIQTQNDKLDGCSYIGRFEHLQEDFDEVCNIIGIPQRTLPHKNLSNLKPYSQFYTREIRNIITERTSKDIDYFGFTFDSTATKNIGIR